MRVWSRGHSAAAPMRPGPPHAEVQGGRDDCPRHHMKNGNFEIEFRIPYSAIRTGEIPDFAVPNRHTVPSRAIRRKCLMLNDVTAAAANRMRHDGTRARIRNSSRFL